MTFWLLMLIINLIVSSTFSALGLHLLRSPKTKQEFFGFKSRMWRKNVDTAKFAYIFCCKYYFFAGLIMIPLSIIAMILVISKPMSTVGFIGTMICTLQALVFATTPLITEIAIRKKFDKYGHRR